MKYSELGFPDIHEHPEFWIDKCLNDLFFLTKIVLHYGKKDDDRPENLELFESQSNHVSFHHKIRNMGQQ
jgi:hypothetical protein